MDILPTITPGQFFILYIFESFLLLSDLARIVIFLTMHKSAIQNDCDTFEKMINMVIGGQLFFILISLIVSIIIGIIIIPLLLISLIVSIIIGLWIFYLKTYLKVSRDLKKRGV